MTFLSFLPVVGRKKKTKNKKTTKKEEIGLGLITRETFQGWGLEKGRCSCLMWLPGPHTGSDLGNSPHRGVEGRGDPSTSFLEVASHHPRSGKRETYFKRICIQKLKANERALRDPCFHGVCSSMPPPLHHWCEDHSTKWPGRVGGRMRTYVPPEQTWAQGKGFQPLSWRERVLLSFPLRLKEGHWNR